MTWQWTIDGTAGTGVNIAPATGSVTMFDIVSMLKQNGWVVKADSDGTTYNSSGGQVTGGGSGAHGLANTDAWIRVQAPDGTREVTIQRGTTNLLWRVKWSHSAHFTGGSPGATQTGSATDEQIRRGGGTDASPTFVTLFAADNTYHLHCGGDTAFPYDWFYTCTATSGGATDARGHYFNMLPGSFPAADVAPYVFEFGSTATWSSALYSTSIGGSYFKKGLTGEAWVEMGGSAYAGFGSASGFVIPASSSTVAITVNPYTGNDSGYPIPVGRQGTLSTPGWKGIINTSSALWPGVSRNQFDFEDFTAPAWVASTSYSIVGQFASNGGSVFRVVATGTSASSGGPTGTSNAITDGSVTWAFVALVTRFTCFDVIMLPTPPGIILS